MKNALGKSALALAVFGLVSASSGLSFAQEAGAETGSHKTETMATTMTTKGTGKARKEKMKMDMTEMKGMMDSCMGAQKDGKTCSGEAMEKCQKDMGHSKGECKGMIKKVAPPAAK